MLHALQQDPCSLNMHSSIVLPHKIADAHLSGSIHIANLENWILKPNEVVHDLALLFGEQLSRDKFSRDSRRCVSVNLAMFWRVPRERFRVNKHWSSSTFSFRLMQKGGRWNDLSTQLTHFLTSMRQRSGLWESATRILDRDRY